MKEKDRVIIISGRRKLTIEMQNRTAEKGKGELEEAHLDKGNNEELKPHHRNCQRAGDDRTE